MTSLQLDRYLDRIGFVGSPSPDFETLRKIHRCHVESIPYENLDVQLGIPVTRDVEASFEKIVLRRRGGWCFEMNGLFAWALEEIGFSVKRLAGGVARDVAGDGMIGNHLVLLIDLDEIWVADAGYGDGLIEPVILSEGSFMVGPMKCSLERIADGWWRYHNDPEGGAPSFDFHPDLTGETLLEHSSASLQTGPHSPFILNAVVQRWVNDEHLSLRGRVFQSLSMAGTKKETLQDADAYIRILKERFNLDFPGAGSLWTKICTRHSEIIGENTT